jgi:Fe-S cluster assembly protein SufD
MSSMNHIAEKISPGSTLVSALELIQNSLPGNEPIRSIRKKALQSFKTQGLPQRKNEEYKYSPVSALFRSELSLVSNDCSFSKSDIAPFLIPGLDAHLIVLINGKFSEKLSDAQDSASALLIYDLGSLAQKPSAVFEKHFGSYASISDDPFAALNTAAFTDVLFIHVPDNTRVEKPIHVLNIISGGTASLINPRILITAGKNASLNVIENYIGLEKTEQVLCNSLTEIHVGEGSKLLFYKIQDNCKTLNLVSTTQVYQEANSHFDTHTVSLSGNWIRNNLNIVADAEHCETHLNGLFILNGNQHVDNHTLVDHRKPNCESNQLYRGILDGKSTGVFNGKIYVRQDAQKTNAYQSSKNMLLSDDASMNTKPQLEIYADDVKCSHGSSTGQIDEDALFYLRARGISTDSAKALLMFAFTKDVVNTIRIEALRNQVEELIEKRLTH